MSVFFVLGILQCWVMINIVVYIDLHPTTQERRSVTNGQLSRNIPDEPLCKTI